jgi:glutamine amidotransferase
MVVLIDYGIGNLRSMEKALEAVGADVVRTDDPDAITGAERVVLPGVGAFGACADEIRRRGLVPAIRACIARGTPFLGVCVGMQLLFSVGEEMGLHPGLDVLPGRVVRFDPTPAGAELNGSAPLKIPHIGWNTVEITRPSPLLEGLGDQPYFYFVHSFYAAASMPEDVLGLTSYGVPFPAIVGRNNVYGVQFHPEKSHRSGLAILNNFINLPARSPEDGPDGAE